MEFQFLKDRLSHSTPIIFLVKHKNELAPVTPISAASSEVLM